MLPGRRPARRPPARVHPDRHGNELRGRGAGHEPGGKHDHPCFCRNHERAAPLSLPPHDLCRSHQGLRPGQAGHPLRPQAGGSVGYLQGFRVQGFCQVRAGQGPARGRRRIAFPQGNRRPDRIRQGLRRPGAGLDQDQGGRLAVAHRKILQRRGKSRPGRQTGAQARRHRLFFRPDRQTWSIRRWAICA